MAKRRGAAAIQLMAVGVAFIAVPWFLGTTPFAKALGTLRPLGWLMLGAGALLLWLLRRSSEDTQPAMPFAVVTEAPSGTPGKRGPAMAMPAAAIPASAGGRPAPGAEPAARPTAWSKAVFDAIEWRRFEALVETLFQQAGFETKSQSHGADGGVDVWLHSRHQPGGPVSIVQCKHWRSRVGVNLVRELRGVMAAHGIQRGQFATTSTFTPDAEAFARDNGIHLLDVDGLLALIARRTPEQQQALLDVALEGDYWRPTCASCGVKMVAREKKGGGIPFWGCAQYPKCKTKMVMRPGFA